MSQYLVLLPEGIKRAEVERKSLRDRPPISFVPPKFDQGSDEDRHEHSVKIKIDKHIEESVTVFRGGTPEAYLSHLSVLSNLINRKELHTKFQGWKAESDSAKYDLIQLDRKQISALQDDDTSLPSAAESSNTDAAPVKKKRYLLPRKKSVNISAHQAKLNKWAAKKLSLCDKRSNADREMKRVVREAFQLYATLLSEEIRVVWQEIVTRVCDTPGWINDTGNEQNAARGYTWAALELVCREWLLTVFKQDAAEHERMYLQFYVIRPDRMEIRPYIARIMQLNQFILHLPCMADKRNSPANLVRMNVPFSEHELAVIILRSFRSRYSDMYYLNNTVPMQIVALRDALESIERVVEKDRKNSKPANSSDHNKGGNTDSNNKRGAGRDTNNKKDKKKKVIKFCQLCHDHGGAEHTHNTNDCRKYEKNGRLLKSFVSKSKLAPGGRTGNDHSSAREASHDKRSFAQMSAKIDQLAQSVGRLRGRSHGHPKRKRHHSRHSGESVSSDSVDSY